MVKKELRERSIKKLKSVPKSRKYILDKLISKKLEKIIDRLNPSSILFYLPLPMEVDLRGLMNRYRKKKLKILIPKVEKESFKMVEYRLPLEENSFKILEPKSQLSYKKVDLIIVPVIAVDKSMRRVGFGKGMYDRFYEKLKNKPKVIFVQRLALLSNTSVCKSFDIKCDIYISSKEKNS